MQYPVEVTVQRKDIYKSVAALKELGEEKLKMDPMHRVALTRKNVDEQIDIMNEVQNKNMTEHALRDDDDVRVQSESGEGFKLDPTRIEEFEDAQKEFMEGEVTLVVFPFKSTDFGKEDKAKAKANIAVGLMAIQAYEIIDSEADKKAKEKPEDEDE